MSALDARTAAKILGGEARGNQAYVPGPGHSKADRSLSILFHIHAPEGFAVYSHAGDDPLVCRDYVKAALGIGGNLLTRVVHASPRPFGPQVGEKCSGKVREVTVQEPGDEERTRYALTFWHDATDPARSPVPEYLKRRSVFDLLPVGALGGALRWHRDGFMVGLVRDVVTNRPKAIHRTFLTATGEKLGRKALGPIGGGAVMLTDPADVTLGLGIGEGIETTLSLRALPDLENLAVWSCLMAGNVRSFPVLPGVESLWIAVDNDPAGIKAAASTADQWAEANRDVVTLEPNAVGADLNDIGGAAHVA